MSILKPEASQRYVIRTLCVVLLVLHYDRTVLENYLTACDINELQQQRQTAAFLHSYTYFQSRPWQRSSTEKAYPAIQEFPFLTESQFSHHAQ
jgi:hypothetical protein